MNLFNNWFVKCIGILGVAYLGYLGVSWALNAFGRLLWGTGYWLQYSILPWMDETFIGLAVVAIVWFGVTSSRRG